MIRPDISVSEASKTNLFVPLSKGAGYRGAFSLHVRVIVLELKELLSPRLLTRPFIRKPCCHPRRPVAMATARRCHSARDVFIRGRLASVLPESPYLPLPPGAFKAKAARTGSEFSDGSVPSFLLYRPRFAFYFSVTVQTFLPQLFAKQWPEWRNKTLR